MSSAGLLARVGTASVGAGGGGAAISGVPVAPGAEAQGVCDGNYPEVITPCSACAAATCSSAGAFRDVPAASGVASGLDSHAGGAAPAASPVGVSMAGKASSLTPAGTKDRSTAAKMSPRYSKKTMNKARYYSHLFILYLKMSVNEYVHLFNCISDNGLISLFNNN